MLVKRIAALGLAGAVGLALALQFWLNGDNPGQAAWGPRLWAMLRYFTILTNALVGFWMLREALGRPSGPNAQATAVLNIAMVGLIFQILLAPEVPLQGLDWWPDMLFHAAIPLATLGWWGLWGDHSLDWRRLQLWLTWPIGYCAYALLRGTADGIYPYFFLDVGRFGASRIALNILGLALAFGLGGAVLAGLARLPRRAALRAR